MTGAANKSRDADDIVIARVARARGIRGEVACDLETDFPERFESLERATLWMADDRRLSFAVEDAWFHKGRVILKFEGVDTMTDAERLVGGRLVISEADLLMLEEDEFYEHHLIGSEVVAAGRGQLGVVRRLLRTGGADLLVVEAGDGRELLIPFVDDICTEVDVEARRITVNPPEGLLEL